MRKSVSTLTQSDTTTANWSSRRKTRSLLIAVFVCIAVGSYCTPWIQSSGASLSLTGYDLAEWTSLVPGIRYGEQPMLVPGLLRAQMLFLTVAITLLPSRRKSGFWWFCGLIAMLLVIAQLPPIEYFLDVGWQLDVNYGQQATLAILSLINASVCWLLPRNQAREAVLVLIGATAIVSAISGVSKSLALATALEIPTSVGLGVVGYFAAILGLVLSATVAFRRGNRNAT